MRTLRALIVDDNKLESNGDRELEITNSLKRLLVSTFQGKVAAFNVMSEDEAVSALCTQEYDIALVDLHLGPDNPFGGANVLVRAWSSVGRGRTELLLYSGEPSVQDAYKSFEMDGGPFRFVLKGEYDPNRPDDHCACLERPLVEGLRHRSKTICQGAVPATVRSQSGPPSVILIDGKNWDLNSLLAPWMCRLTGEPAPERELIFTSLFPSDDLIRIFTYWFKAQAGQMHLWPNTSMYGLKPLEEYHCGCPTGPMDALMHTAVAETKAYARAGEVALEDLQIIKLLAERKVVDDFKTYIAAAKSWDGIVNTTRDEFKNTVKFEFGEILDAFTRSLHAPCPVFIPATLEAILPMELYCAPETPSKKPAIMVAAAKIAESLTDHAGINCGITIKADSKVFTQRNDTDTDLPYVTFAIRHDGEPCPPSKDIGDWFKKGRSLGQAAELLKGYATWTVLSKADGIPRSHEAILGLELSADRAADLWNVFADDRTNVIHILRFGIPLFCVRH